MFTLNLADLAICDRKFRGQAFVVACFACKIVQVLQGRLDEFFLCLDRSGQVLDFGMDIKDENVGQAAYAGKVFFGACLCGNRPAPCCSPC